MRVARTAHMKERPKRLKRGTPEALDAKAIGERIASVRVARDWRQCDLAFIAGVSKGALAAYETGVRIPDLTNLMKLSAALRRTTDWILYGRRRRLWRGRRNNGTEGAGVAVCKTGPTNPAGLSHAGPDRAT